MQKQKDSRVVKPRNRTPDFVRKAGPMRDRRKEASRKACRRAF